MTASETKTARPLDGWRVLVPRGGPWGDGVAASLRAMGAGPGGAPLLSCGPTPAQDARGAALERLQAGEYDWLTITSATTVDVLYAHRVEIPSKTKVAAVGETTAAALQAVGYDVALMPELDNSAAGMAEKIISIEPDAQRILTLRSEVAAPVLSVTLPDTGHDLDGLAASLTVGVPVTDRIRRDVENGRINAILITSGSVAKQVREQFPEIPDTTMLAAIGPRTARDAEKVGLPVTAIADKQTVDALIDTVSRFTLPHAADEFAP